MPQREDLGPRGRPFRTHATRSARRQANPGWADAAGPYVGFGPRNHDPTGGVHVDVGDGLTEHPYLDAQDIELTVEAGEVTLTGTVADRAQKRLANDVAWSVPGVRDVHNHLRIRGHGSAGGSDG